MSSISEHLKAATDAELFNLLGQVASQAMQKRGSQHGNFDDEMEHYLKAAAAAAGEDDSVENCTAVAAPGTQVTVQQPSCIPSQVPQEQHGMLAQAEELATSDKDINLSERQAASAHYRGSPSSQGHQRPSNAPNDGSDSQASAETTMESADARATRHRNHEHAAALEHRARQHRSGKRPWAPFPGSIACKDDPANTPQKYDDHGVGHASHDEILGEHDTHDAYASYNNLNIIS